MLYITNIIMKRKTDTNEIEVPGAYEVLDATALGERLGLKRATILSYLARREFGRIPRPNRRLSMGPICTRSQSKNGKMNK
jgi:hypothetical protein